MFGTTALTLLIHLIDVSKFASHQGAQAVIDKLNKDKIVAYDQDGTEIDLRSFVETKIKSCGDCQQVLEFKRRGEMRGRLTWMSEEDVPDVLRYGDRLHTGYQGIHQAIKTWCDFDDYEKRVGPTSSPGPALKYC